MPFIKQIEDHEATGLVKKELDRARKRAGRVWNIVRIMSLNAQVMRDSMQFYIATMKGRSPLTRAQREMLAVVVSAANHCVYWIRAHAHDLRAEVDWFDSDEQADAYVEAVAKDWRSAPLSNVDRVLCAYAEKLTRAPQTMREADLDDLREMGLGDAAIHDAVQVVAYFNYINRVADALGVENEDFIRPWGGHS